MKEEVKYHVISSLRTSPDAIFLLCCMILLFLYLYTLNILYIISSCQVMNRKPGKFQKLYSRVCTCPSLLLPTTTLKLGRCSDKLIRPQKRRLEPREISAHLTALCDV